MPISPVFLTFFLSLSLPLLRSNRNSIPPPAPLPTASSLSTSARPASQATPLCNTQSCDECNTFCRPYHVLQTHQQSCETSLPHTASVWPWDAYVTCVHQQCTPYFFQHACGLFKPQKSPSILSQLDAQLDTVSARIRTLIQQRQQYFKARVVNTTLQQYYTRSVQQIKKCDKLFIDALTQRALHSDLTQYMQSVDYRIIRQEVKRLRFENEDFARHLNFWKRHNQTLSLVTRTSPDALRDARNALYREMKNYETDALVIKSLRVGSYTKEKQARFTIRLRKKVTKQLHRLRTQNERVLREAQFIQEARTELYHLLLRIWQDIRKRRVNVSCGRDVLSEAVTSAFKSEINS